MKLRIYKTLLAISFIVIGIFTVNAQSTYKVDLEKATTEYKSLRFVSAIKELKKVLDIDTGNLKAQEMIAHSYKMTKNYQESMYWYEKLMRQTPLKSDWALNYAEVLANNQQYERSEGWYRKYLELIPTDKRAEAFSKTNPSQLNKNLGNWTVTFTNLNSQGSDYAPVYYKNGLIFTSNRQTQKISKRIFQWDNTPFSNLYVLPSLQAVKSVNPDSLMVIAQNDEDNKLYRFNDDDTAPTSNDTKTIGQFNTSLERDTLGIILENGLNLELLKGTLNSKYHDGPASVFPDGSIIFTRNNYYKGKTQKSKDGVIKLKMYIASGNNHSRINEFPYNSNDYSTGHPTLNKEGNILIFASDMPGGYGGSDLYYCVRSGLGPWTRPVNLGKKINTEGNELFPHLDKDVLYFASTGHPGLGGLDIFEIALKEMKPQGKPVNLGSPINTSKDDFALIISDDRKNGFFSSNRRGDDDIYAYKKASHTIILEGTVKDTRTKLPLQGSRLLMRHLDGVDTIRTNAKGEFRRELPKEVDFEITAQKLGYVNAIDFVSSIGIAQDTVIKMDLFLGKAETAQEYVLNNCDSLKRAFAVQNIYYDLDRSDIRSDARPALDELANLMKNHPQITIITSSHCDSRASEAYNRNLSIRRGEAAKAYLVNRGIAASRIKIEYYGKTRLVNRCYDGMPCSEADQQLNRRTEFDVILNGVNITRQNCDE